MDEIINNTDLRCQPGILQRDLNARDGMMGSAFQLCKGGDVLAEDNSQEPKASPAMRFREESHNGWLKKNNKKHPSFEMRSPAPFNEITEEIRPV